MVASSRVDQIEPLRIPGLLRVGLMLGIGAAVSAPAFANGAYFPTSWGWATAAFGWVAAIGLVVRRDLRLGKLEWALIGALFAAAGWTALSVAWSPDVTQTVLEVERALVYLTGVTAVLVVAGRRRFVPQLLGAILAAITTVAVYALGTRLFPERLGGFDDLALNRLARPLGYWNSLGLFVAMGALLALAFAARARSLVAQALAGAALPLLALTLYFTFSRGAWIALGAGLLVALALDTRRLQLMSALLAAAPASALAIWVASRSPALTSKAPTLASASHEGHRLTPIVLGLAVAGAFMALLRAFVERRLPNLPRVRIASWAGIWAAVAASLAAMIVVFGGPWTIARKSYDQFTRAPVSGTASANLNKRLFSLSGNGRADFWAAAWHDARDHAWLGSGAGTFEQYWLHHRHIPSQVRDAHSLYMETLAELGPPGLGLLVLALAIPVLGAFRARSHPLVSCTAGAYAAYLVHAGVDWDWEVVAVTLTAFFCAAALLILGREGRELALSLPLRTIAVVSMIAVVGFGALALVSNSALSSAGRATDREDWVGAEAQARKAIRWAPWSSAGWRMLGEAQLQQAKFAQARASFRKAIAADGRDWSLWLDLALASKGRAQREAAAQALALNPLSPEIAQLRPGLGLKRTREH